MTELFRCDDLLVRRRGQAGGPLVVTFASYTNDPSLDRPGFGEEFLAGEGIDAIHVVGARNAWYRHPDTPAMLAAVRAASRSATRVVTYGSSMGGYAALRFAAHCRADAAIALSPQFSMEPRLVPWESRWQVDVARIDHAELPYAAAPRQFVFYDPRHAQDAGHADLIAREGDTHLIRLPFAGHPVGAVLTETGLLRHALRDIIDDTFDATGFTRRLREERRQSRQHLYGLARELRHRRPEVALSLVARAAAIEPESHIVTLQARLLDRLKRHEEAAPLHLAAVARTRSNTIAWLGLARHRELTGDPKGAAQALRDAFPIHSDAARTTVRTEQVRLWLRSHGLGWLDRAMRWVLRRSRTAGVGTRTVRIVSRLARRFRR